MSESYLTVTSLARALQADRRDVQKIAGEPDAVAVEGKGELKLYHESRVQQLAAALIAAAKGESSKQDFETDPETEETGDDDEDNDDDDDDGDDDEKDSLAALLVKSAQRRK
jgi:hypothetical protein